MATSELAHPQLEAGCQLVTPLEVTGVHTDESCTRSKSKLVPRPGLWRTGIAMWELRLARLMTSGPPPKELKGGVPVTTWAEAGRGRKRARRRKNSAEGFLHGNVAWRGRGPTQLRLSLK